MTPPAPPPASTAPILVGFSTPTRFNPVSWLIRRVTRATVSHTWFLYFDQDFGVEMVADAHETGFRVVPYDVFRRSNRVVALVTPAVDIWPGFRRLTPLWVGRANYDFVGLGVAGLLTVFSRWLRRSLRNPLRSDLQVMCSEAVVRVLQYVHHPETQDLDPESCTPQDLLVRLRKVHP